MAETATPEQAAAAVAAIRARLQQGTGTAPAEPENAKYIQHDFADEAGNKVTAYSKDNKPRSVSELQAAAEQFVNTGKAPEGTIVLRPGIVNALRSGYEAVNQPIQRGAAAIAGATLAPNEMPPELAQMMQTNPDYRFALGMNRGVIPQAAESVSTPGRAGMTAATLAVSPALKAVTKTTELGAAGAPMVMNMLRNMGLMGSAATAGNVGGKLATGEPLQGLSLGHGVEIPFAADVVIPFTAAAATQGFMGVLSHFVNRYMSPNYGQKIAKEVFDEVKGQYPDLKNDPVLLDAAVSVPAKLARVTQIMSKGLRGDLEDNVTTMVADINQILPRRLTTGTQNTVRAQVRAIIRAGDDILDNLGNADAKAAAEQALTDAGHKIYNAVAAEFKAMKAPDQIAMRVDKLIESKIGKPALQQFYEGADVLAALKRSGAANGFNASAFVNEIRGTSQANPGSLIDKVGRIAGQGTPLTEGVAGQPGINVGGYAWNTLKAGMPDIISRFMSRAPTRTAPGPALLPWQMDRALPAPVNAGAAVGGTQAIKSFLEDTK
jgi:hypothetical protein